MIYFLIIVFAVYAVYTLNFVIKFNKGNVYFNKNQKIIHNILIWVIPFIWITIIKILTKPILGSDKYKNRKSDAGLDESGIGMWGDSETYSDSGYGDGGGDH